MVSRLPHGFAWTPSTPLISNEKSRTSTGKCSYIKPSCGEHTLESEVAGYLKESFTFLIFETPTRNEKRDKRQTRIENKRERERERENCIDEIPSFRTFENLIKRSSVWVGAKKEDSHWSVASCSNLIAFLHAETIRFPYNRQPLFPSTKYIVIFETEWRWRNVVLNIETNILSKFF